MNKEALLRVADAIEKHGKRSLGFNMAYWCAEADQDAPDQSGHGCKTTACIAGWAVAIKRNASAAKLERLHVTSIIIPEEASDFLGLRLHESFLLFHTGPMGRRKESILPSEAVRTLRYAAEHGVIDWDKANG